MSRIIFSILTVIFTCCFCLLSTLSLKAQNNNPCGVKAIMSPAGDSILTTYSFFKFQSISSNATDYRFIIDHLQFPFNYPITSWRFGPGLTTVKLVAYNGSCTDTAVSYYFFPGWYPSDMNNSNRLYGYPNRFQEVTNLAGVSTGGYVLAGVRPGSYDLNEHQQGLLIKTKEPGCIEWARKLEGSFSGFIRMVKEAENGSGFFVLAEVDYNNQFIAKLDTTGNLLWAKKLGEQNGMNVIGLSMDGLPDGGVAVTGFHPSVGKPFITRLSNNGVIMWQKEYDFNFNIARFTSVLFKEDHLYVGGNSYANNEAFITKIDFVRGQAVWTKKYTCPNGNIQLGELSDIDTTLLVNIFTPSGTYNTPAIGGYMRIDTSGRVLKAGLIAESYVQNPLVSPYYAGSSHFIRSGKSFYILSAGAASLSMQPYVTYITKVVKLDSACQVAWVKSYGGSNAPRFFFEAPAPNDGVAILGNEVGATQSPISSGKLFSLKLIDSAKVNPANDGCYFFNQPYVIVPLSITPQPVQWNEMSTAYIAANGNFPLHPFYPEMRFRCPDYVDSCSYLKLRGTRSVCNLSQTYEYKAFKNKGCVQPTVWNIPAAVQTITKNDSSVTVRFPAFGRYVIYGTNPFSCIPVQDSIVIIAESETPPLDLGPDQQICPQNVTTLHAGPAYISYQWQDGSTDSVFLVNAPGQYWVKVTDSCNNALSDTINISLALPSPFSIGPDRTKCNNDTLHLLATPGFMNYRWSPHYNISDTTMRTVIINPLSDTFYTAIAEKTPGCFAYDTVLISVNHSPAIHLGADTSFCAGDSVVLNAGPGFQQYVWNNGASANQITVFRKGSYSVTAITMNGCRSSDTINVVNVFNNPVVQLGNDTVLCTGSMRILHAGNFSAYVWQDGNTGSVYKVNSLGKYYVTVTDDNHCMGSDTININRLLSVPLQFLPSDTALCSYGTLVLKSNMPFERYVWSNGATSATNTINQPGMYWLQATDQNNCTGNDTIIVYPKDCMIGLYVPSAFTPNNDGKNDVFKPMLFGKVKQYSFSVYNRWGQRLFYTTEPGKGWDGRNSDYLQNTNVFVWVCTYQLEDAEVKSAKGTVTLIN